MPVNLEEMRRCSVAVDLGASRSRVYVKDTGIVVDEPSVVAVNTRTAALLAVGEMAERMTGRTPDHIRVVRPVQGGTVVNVDLAQRMLRHLIGGKLRRTRIRRPGMRFAACVPYDSEPLAQRAVRETLAALGARRVELADTLVCAAVGSGLPVEDPEATMIVLCGAGTTQVAVLSLGSIVAAETVPVGGDSLDHAVVEHLRGRHELLLAHHAVRPLRTLLHTPGRAPAVAEVHGRDVRTGLARTVAIDIEGVRQAVNSPLTAVLDAIRTVLRRCPPDLVADLSDRGVVLAGGSALLTGLDGLLSSSTGMPVRTAETPDTCAVRGLGAMMEGRVEAMRLDPLAG
ncbi:rod shape-determining protein [Streptomyces zingiberis]|uniref:Cell shape-determining protein MreB n=1 Tax=Streptomyces zingiberis TaxID=2053010 RepID=A0ABX1BY69_9ACTN|nr:rod shape-determining protein [Streptomyces zingiberis]NJQ02626.1 rod shape-determining protein [Streptomyces zingiberis]